MAPWLRSHIPFALHGCELIPNYGSAVIIRPATVDAFRSTEGSREVVRTPPSSQRFIPRLGNLAVQTRLVAALSDESTSISAA